MDVFGVSILEYLGKVDGGILVLIGIVYDDEYFESTFFYNQSDILLTSPEELEIKIGPITEHPNYFNLISDILKKVIPYDEIIDNIDHVDFGRWVKNLEGFNE